MNSGKRDKNRPRGTCSDNSFADRGWQGFLWFQWCTTRGAGPSHSVVHIQRLPLRPHIPGSLFGAHMSDHWEPWSNIGALTWRDPHSRASQSEAFIYVPSIEASPIRGPTLSPQIQGHTLSLPRNQTPISLLHTCRNLILVFLQTEHFCLHFSYSWLRYGGVTSEMEGTRPSGDQTQSRAASVRSDRNGDGRL